MTGKHHPLKIYQVVRVLRERAIEITPDQAREWWKFDCGEREAVALNGRTLSEFLTQISASPDWADKSLTRWRREGGGQEV